MSHFILFLDFTPWGCDTPFIRARACSLMMENSNFQQNSTDWKCHLGWCGVYAGIGTRERYGIQNSL